MSRSHLRWMLSRPLRELRLCWRGMASTSIPSNVALYEVDKAVCAQLNYSRFLPSTLRKQLATLEECVLLARRPLLEVCHLVDAAQTRLPAIRSVLWGPFGTGKSTTLLQAAQYAMEKEWVVVYLHSGLQLTRQVQEVEMSSHVQGRINDPNNATTILQQFKQQNAHVWKKLSEHPLSQTYEWTKKEKSEEGRPLAEVVELALTSPLIASDCLGGLFRELRIAANKGQFSLFVGIDDANSLFGKTLVKRADRSFAPPEDLTLVQHFTRLMEDDWFNGVVLMVADKKETSSARDKVTVPRNTPLELFGEKGLNYIEPFIPIETTVYSEKEAELIYNYYLEKNWLTTPEARSVEGKKQIMYLSAFNPYYLERMCAFV